MIDKFKLIATRTERKLRPVYDYYISHHRDIQHSVPRVLQLAKLEPFKSLVYEAPADQELNPADFLAHLDAIPQVFDSWKEGIVEHLLTLLGLGPGERADSDASAKGKGREVISDGNSVLGRATTIFNCKQCCGLLLYPYILTHGCLVDSGYARHRKGDYNCEWNEEDQVEVHEQASRYARAIVIALGQDPNTATWEQLDKDNQRVECTRCRIKPTRKSRNKNIRLVMNWRHAVRLPNV